MNKKIIKIIIIFIASSLLTLFIVFSSVSKVMNVVSSIKSTLSSWFTDDNSNYSEADYIAWINGDLINLEKLYDSKYINFNLAESISLLYRFKYHTSIIQDISDWNEYLQIFTSSDKSYCLQQAKSKYNFSLNDEDEYMILQLNTAIAKSANLIRNSSYLGIGDLGFYAEENTIIPKDSIKSQQFWSLVEYVCDANNCLSAQARTRQCTAFVFYRFNETYHLPYINGDGWQVAYWIVENYPEQFYLSHLPAAGSVFSVAASDRYSIHGHVGFIEKVAEEDGQVYVWFSDGNCPQGYARLNMKLTLEKFFNQFGDDVIFACSSLN